MPINLAHTLGIMSWNFNLVGVFMIDSWRAIGNMNEGVNYAAALDVYFDYIVSHIAVSHVAGTH